MALDVEYLITALKSAAHDGVASGLKVIQQRAQELAPVRKIFKAGRGKSKKVSLASPSDALGGPREMSAGILNHAGYMETGGWPVHYGRQVIPDLEHSDRAYLSQSRQANFVATKVYRGGSAAGIETGHQKMVTQREKIGGSIRGKVNSYAPVIQSPSGRIGGAELRHWSGAAGSGVLELKTINDPVAGPFDLANLLSARGRYEVRTGRGVTENEEGKKMVGGALRKSITVEGPIVNGDSVYGYVSAKVTDPGRTPPHNYARDQEFGSRHNKPQAFLRPALRESKAQIINLERGVFAKAFKGGARPKHTSDSAVKPIRLRAKVSFTGWSRVMSQILPRQT
jgi:HK97 gp10 family phage protein